MMLFSQVKLPPKVVATVIKDTLKTPGAHQSQKSKTSLFNEKTATFPSIFSDELFTSNELNS